MAQNKGFLWGFNQETLLTYWTTMEGRWGGLKVQTLCLLGGRLAFARFSFIYFYFLTAYLFMRDTDGREPDAGLDPRTLGS